MKEGMKEVMKELMNKNSNVKLTFQYPNFSRPTLKSGKVKSIQEDCFIIDEKFDGISSYGYDYLIEVREELE